MANYLLFGGTFDPVHNGHIRIASVASLKLNADVIFVPARSPRWKTPLTSAKHRVNMLKLAMKNCVSSASILDYELKSKDDINYTIDTLKYFKSKHPNDKIYLVIGADQVNQFPEWKNAEEIANLAQIVFVSRPRYTLNKEIIDTYKMIDLSYLESGDVSSTMVREMKSVDIPLNVLHYIEDNRLYYVNQLAKYISEKRLNHSIEVANLALKIARVNKLDHLEKYFIAGLFHDIGKTYVDDSLDAINFMKKNYPEYVDLPKFAYHQFIGEYLARVKIGIEDKEILDAIKFHCTGNKNMGSVAKIVYASDKIEPTRGFDSSGLINSCLKNYEQGFIDTLVDNKKYLLNHNKDITNKLTDACFEMYLPKKGK